MTTDPRTWNAGEMVTAAMLNQEIRDQLNSMFGAWTPYTPAWTAATTNPALGNGTMIGRYLKIGRTVQFHVELTMGSTTTYGSGAWSLSLPFAAAAGAGTRVGLAHAVGTIRAAGHTLVAPLAANFQCFFPASGSVSNLSNAGATNPFTWAAGNGLRATLTYETAA
ncbi:hypothetical protein ACFVZJ_21475 [Streptomyces sp. NPDC058322]|uniref:hypothetical protein n=1 Tax=Streptomyces sp. NPDC058322 TaxID=3346446 RepID=UPI0036DFF464